MLNFYSLSDRDLYVYVSLDERPSIAASVCIDYVSHTMQRVARSHRNNALMCARWSTSVARTTSQEMSYGHAHFPKMFAPKTADLRTSLRDDGETTRLYREKSFGEYHGSVNMLRGIESVDRIQSCADAGRVMRRALSFASYAGEMEERISDAERRAGDATSGCVTFAGETSEDGRWSFFDSTAAFDRVDGSMKISAKDVSPLFPVSGSAGRVRKALHCFPSKAFGSSSSSVEEDIDFDEVSSNGIGWETPRCTVP